MSLIVPGAGVVGTATARHPVLADSLPGIRAGVDLAFCGTMAK
jgi:hypothetical protein